MTPLIRSVVNLLPDSCECVWFDMGEIKGEPFDCATMPLFRLPFHRTAICGYDSEGYKCVLLAEQVHDLMIAVGAWCLKDKEYAKMPMMGVVFEESHKGCSIGSLDENSKFDARMAATFVGALFEFMGRLEPVGYRPTKKKSHLNKVREKKGKPALLYDWHTVQVTYPQVKREHQGGTHASPRRHQRRGHWRRHPNGSRIWVKDCWVGDASRGTIFKDYEVRV